MLIKCPECSLQISDKAQFCPHCGMPFTKLDKPKISSKKMKLPNGFGQITKLNKRLRKPYRAMITIGHYDNGRPKCRLLKPIAYFESYNDAYQALVEYNMSPIERDKHMTLLEVFTEWLDKKEDKVTTGSVRRYKASFKRLVKYQDYPISEIRPRLIQSVVEETKKESINVASDVKSLLNTLMDYAVNNEILEKNYARNTRIDITPSTEQHHIPFTDEDMQKLWKHSDEQYVQWILIQCYTGMRPGELCNIRIENINLDENYMIGGMKTKAGTDRTIPIHPCIKDFIIRQIEVSKFYGSEYLLSDFNNPSRYPYEPYKKHFYKVRDAYGLESSHTPHDCRSYFITQAKKYGMNEYAIKRIVGHNISDITEAVYTTRGIDWLYEQICLIPGK